MVQEGSFARIGELFTGAGILSPVTLDSRLAMSRENNIPLGRALVQAGDLTSYQLLGVVQIQSLLHDGLVELEVALTAIKLIHKESLAFDTALDRLGYAKPSEPTCKLGELLLESNLISQSELFTALSACFETCLPLGAILIERKIQSSDAIQLALSLQRQVRNRLLTRQAAIERLKLGFLGATNDAGDYTWLAHKADYASTVKINEPQPASPAVIQPALVAPVVPQIRSVVAPTTSVQATPVPAANTVAAKSSWTLSIPDSVNVLRTTAQQNYKLGKLGEAERGYADALKESEKIGEKESILCLSDMAGFYVKRGEPKLAYKLFERAVILAERHLTASHAISAELRRKRDALRSKMDIGTPLPDLQWLS